MPHHLLLPVAKIQRYDISPIARDVGWREREVHLSAERHPLLVNADPDGREVRVSHRSPRTQVNCWCWLLAAYRQAEKKRN